MSTVISIIAIIISFATLLVMLYTAHDSDQWQLFSEYTGRYASIIDTIPTEVLDEKECIAFDNKPIRKYFDLCSEEHYLHTKKMIPAKVWSYWEDGMKLTMRNHYFLETWQIESIQNGYNDKFKDFMNDIVEEALSNTTQHS